jgi:nucleoside-diphosphate-sugar epimerase
MTNPLKVLVTGAGGFIGHHLVTRLKQQGYWVRGVDLTHPEYAPSDADQFLVADLREPANAIAAAQGVDHVYALAADMGGMGYISAHHALILHNNSLINIFGPLGTWDGGREKAPAAMCRKVAVAKLTGQTHIDIWGDGEQTRSFCYVDDCLDGLMRLMASGYHLPLNLGQDRLVTINQLADIVGDIAGVALRKHHVPGPQGVRGRNSNNTRLRQVLGWEPHISLEDGLARTYPWIEDQVRLSISVTAAGES